MAESVRQAFIVSPDYLEAGFAAAEKAYGDMGTYFREGLGIPDELISEFCRKVLTD